jgi:hypothetical protein
MRNVIYAINVTIDGCCDHTSTIADEEVLAYNTQLIRDADLLVFGRKTYQLMIPYWPDVIKDPSATETEKEFARTFDFKNKIVFSRSLDSAEGNTRIVRTKLQDEILKIETRTRQKYFSGRCKYSLTTFVALKGAVFRGIDRFLIKLYKDPKSKEAQLADKRFQSFVHKMPTGEVMSGTQ